MSSANQLVRSKEFQQNCHIYKTTKNTIKKRSQHLKNIIDNNTKKEVEAVKIAHKQLDSKVKEIMNHPKIKKEKEIIEKDYKYMKMSLDKVMDIFSQARNIIMKDDTITNIEKTKYLTSLEKKMMEKLYDEDEINQFKRLVSNMVIMIPNHQPLIGTGQLPTDYNINNKKELANNDRIFDRTFDLNLNY